MSNKSKGDTAMRNARTWVANNYPGAESLEAGKRVARYPHPSKPGEWMMHTIAEDLFGVFDIMVFPTIARQGGVACIQVTTITDGKLGAVNARKAKVGTWIRDNFAAGDEPDWMGDIFVIGWVSRKHFRVWEWQWVRTGAKTWGRWDELEPQRVTRPKQAAAACAAPQMELDCPFD